jgi:hypothetical protein
MFYCTLDFSVIQSGDTKLYHFTDYSLVQEVISTCFKPHQILQEQSKMQAVLLHTK